MSSLKKRKNIKSTSHSEPPRKKHKNNLHIIIVDSDRNSLGSDMSTNINRRRIGTTKKKLSIKPFKVKPTIPDDFEQQTWKKLKEAIIAVFEKQETNYSQEELYKAVQDLCIHKFAPSLYQKLRTECQIHIEKMLKKLVGQTPDQLAFLSMVVKTWEDFCDQMLTIRSIFLYLDRTYVIQNSGVRSLWDMGLQLFRDLVAKAPEIEKKTVQGVLYLIETERNGDSIERSTVRKILRMFMALQIYEESFEKLFLEKTSKYYEEEGRKFMQEMSVPEYLRHVESRINQEQERADAFLGPSTKKPLKICVEQNLIKEHLEPLLDKGFDILMSQNRLDDLSRMYNLFSLVDGLEPLKVKLEEFIKKNGMEIVCDKERDKTMIQDLLEFKEKIDNIYFNAFKKNESFKYSLKRSFEKFMNARQNKPAELIAKFVDSKLRVGAKGLGEEELEKIMDQAMMLFKFIEGKDVFEAFYKNHLAKRLLLGTSASFDAEKSMIARLKTECGSSFTNKLEGMFKDIDLSKDIMQAFKTSKEYQKLGDIDLNVTVITTGYWPPYTPEPVNLPKELNDVQDVFKNFYLEKYGGRKLNWQSTLGQCTLRANFPKGKKEIQVSQFQGVVLLLFNDADKLSYAEIKEKTGIRDDELKRTLQSLAVGRVDKRVLLKQPKGKDISEDDVFYYNKNFQHQLFRIRINQVQMKETAEEQQNTEEKVLIERAFQIDACIVRVMKARKRMSHANLVKTLHQQLRFPVKASDIKKRIESLLDRDYIARDKEEGSENSCMYSYVA